MQHQQHAQRDLSHPAMLILASLVQGPKHAVALCEAIGQMEDLFFEPGTLYRVLARLEQRGWIEGLHAGGPLRWYHITALGLLAFESAAAGRQREQSQEGGRPALLHGKEIIMRLVIWMLRLYPPAWRERYEAEMVALLEQHEITFFTVVDLLVGALDARLDPHYRRARPLVPLRRL
jgi:DNA-binding PadR family transcriptional regulator